MNLTIPIYQLDTKTSIENIPYHQLEKDWFNEQVQHPVFFRLMLEGNALIFDFKTNKKPFYQPNHQSGHLVKGLWQFDVAELFFLDKETGRYQEFNFGPQGAYWSAVFSSYRQLEIEIPFKPISWCACHLEQEWEIQFRLSLDDISVGKIGSPNLLMNVCSILYNTEPIYLSYGTPQTTKPNFHKPETFCEIDLK